MDDRGIHPAEEEFGVATGPAVIADLVQLPTHRNQLGQVAVVVGVSDRKQAGGFG